MGIGRLLGSLVKAGFDTITLPIDVLKEATATMDWGDDGGYIRRKVDKIAEDLREADEE